MEWSGEELSGEELSGEEWSKRVLISLVTMLIEIAEINGVPKVMRNRKARK